jgi:hypothetical protein
VDVCSLPSFSLSLTAPSNAVPVPVLNSYLHRLRVQVRVLRTQRVETTTASNHRQVPCLTLAVPWVPDLLTIPQVDRGSVLAGRRTVARTPRGAGWWGGEERALLATRGTEYSYSYGAHTGTIRVPCTCTSSWECIIGQSHRTRPPVHFSLLLPR